MALDSDSRFPPLPDVFTDKLKNIDPEGTQTKQEELQEWWTKVQAALQTGN